MLAKYATPSSETAMLLPARKKRTIMKRDSLTILLRAHIQVKIDIGGLQLQLSSVALLKQIRLEKGFAR